MSLSILTDRVKFIFITFFVSFDKFGNGMLYVAQLCPFTRLFFQHSLSELINYTSFLICLSK